MKKDISVYNIRTLLAYAFLGGFLFSCGLQDNKDLPSYKVFNKDFENTIVIDGFVEPVNTTTLVCPPRIDGVVAYLIEDGTYVEVGDTVCQIEMQELQTNYDQMVLNLENAKAGFNKTKAELHLQYTLLEAQVKNNEADTQIAQLDSLQLIYSPENQRKIKELELEKVLIEKDKHGKKLEALAIINQSEIRKMEIEIQQFTNRVNSMKAQLDQLTIKSTKAGLAMRPIYRVTNSQLNIGDPVWTNMPLVIIPEMTAMKVKIMAPERDYKYISVDDSVFFTFDAMPGNYAWGKITKKAPVGQQYKKDSKVKHFEIEASIDSCQSLPEPGFTANCHILLKEIKDTLVIPQIAIFREDSIRVVYVERKKGYEMRQILTGLTSQKEAIVTAGLEEFESISMTKPKSSLVKKRVLLPDSIINPVSKNGLEPPGDTEGEENPEEMQPVN